MAKVCKECGEAMTLGRADKQFCSGYCRSTHHNKAKKKPSKLVQEVNRTLLSNRKILADLNPSGKTKVKRSKMQERGFNFNYYTNTYTTKSGKTYIFCYDQGYLTLDEDYLALVVKQEYVS